ncbi:MAG: HEAT repeat domain-containing protein [Caulobacterales bacterium]|nr:HEAT repeat domain-containing protein [Caulobacterales bacterium]
MALDLVWRSIDLTVGLSAMIMALLLIGRVAEARKQRLQARDAARGQQTLQAFMLGEAGPTLRVDLLRHAESVVQALSVIRGLEADRLIERLRQVGLISAMAEKLRRQGQHPDVHLIEAYAHLARPEDAQALLQSLLTAKGARRRQVIIEGLLRAGAPPDLRLAIELLAEDGKASSVDCALIESIAAARADEAEALLQSPEPMPNEFRAALATGLGQTGRFSAIAPLARLSVREDQETAAAAAVAALGELGHPLAGGAVLQALYAHSPRIRLNACRAATELRLTGLIDALSERLEDPDWDVRFEASQALVALGSPGRARLRRISDGRPGRASQLARETLLELPA